MQVAASVSKWLFGYFYVINLFSLGSLLTVKFYTSMYGILVETIITACAGCLVIMAFNNVKCCAHKLATKTPEHLRRRKEAGSTLEQLKTIYKH